MRRLKRGALGLDRGRAFVAEVRSDGEGAPGDVVHGNVSSSSDLSAESKSWNETVPPRAKTALSASSNDGSKVAHSSERSGENATTA